MKIPVILTAAVLVCAASVWSGDEPTPDSPKRLGAELGLLRDGGSNLITIPAHGDQAACKVYIDWAGDTKTPGEMFLEGEFDGDRPGKQLTWAQAERRLQQLEQVLIAYYGAEELLEIVLNPIEPGIHVSEAEYIEQMTTDPVFVDRLEARSLMDAIIAYRTRHGPLLKRK